MKSIKIKVKYILIFLILLLVSFCFIVPMSLLSYGKMVQEKNPDKSKQAYSSVISFNPFNIGKDTALFKLANIILPDEIERNKYIIYNTGMSRNGQYINYEMVNKAEEYLREIIDEYEDSKYYTDAYKKLFHLNIMCGRLDKAKALTESGLKSDNSIIRDMSLRYSMLLSFIEKDYEKVLNIGNSLIKENKIDYDTYILMGDIYYIENKFDQASKYYTEAKKLSNNGLINSTERWSFETDKNAFSSLRLIDKTKYLLAGTGKIKGRVEVNGKAIPFAYIYLNINDDNIIGTTGMENETIFAVTDSKGNYEFNTLPSRTYSLGIGIYSIYLTDSVYQSPNESYIYLKNGETVNYDFKFVPPLKIIKPLGLYETNWNEVDISWDNVKNAEYYNISIVAFEKPNKLEGSNVRFVIAEGIKETSHTLNLEKINSRLYGFMLDQEGKANPQAYLGPFYPGSTVPVIIDAFDKNNNKITSSVPINIKYNSLSLIKVPNKNIKNGDKLLLEGNIDKAVLEYEKELKNNPRDTHTLLVLSKIYSIGTKITHDKSGKETAEGRNPERAFELATKLYEITGNIDYQRNTLRSLMSNSDKNIKWVLEKYKGIDEKNLEYEDFSIMGNLNLIAGNLKEAHENYEKMFSMLGSKNYYDLKPALLEIYNKDYETAFKYLSKTDFSLHKFDKETFEKNVLLVIKGPKDTMEYKKFEDSLRIVLRMGTTLGTKEKFLKEYEGISHPIYKNILKQIGNYYYLFQE